jgi:hypothetical protein
MVTIVLGVTIYYIKHRQQIKRKKTAKLLNEFIKERATHRGSINTEIEHLDEMLKNRYIDKDTYKRLKIVLQSKEGPNDLIMDDLMKFFNKK